ncbi:hypothetical protein D3C81_1302180 [compost metagenome]
MGRVWRQTQVNGFAIVGFDFRRETQMVFYVTTKVYLWIVCIGFTFKFREDGFVRFTHDIGQYVQTTTVSHTDYKLLDANF